MRNRDLDDVTQIEYQQGVEFLKSGQLEKGWEAYDLRYGYGKIGTSLSRDTRHLYWTGEKSDGVVLVDDQGYGDFFHFARYIPMVQRRVGGIVEVACKPGLPELILDSFPGVRIIPLERNAGDMWFYSRTNFPYHLITSLGRLFGTSLDTIPRDVPYIKTKVQKWTNARIGLCWTSEVTWADNYEIKSIPYKLIEPLILRDDAMSLLGIDLKTNYSVENWRDTAAIIDNLDLVITGDFAVAHLSGALGKPTWVLLPYDCDWRWMRDRTDSPWYPTARLIRQTTPGDWIPVIKEVTRWLNP